MMPTAGRRIRPHEAILAFVVVLMTPLVLAPQARAADAPVTACDAARRAEGLVPIRSIDLPTASQQWAGKRPTYTFQATSIPQVDRVGYCLELGNAAESQWAFAAHQATGQTSDLQLPTQPTEVTRRSAYDLTVRSNVAGVAPVDHGNGWLEMWPSSYSRTASRVVPGSYDGDAFTSDKNYDADDTPSTGNYGSFQVHQVGESATTVLAVNRWATVASAIDLGIGARATNDTDWTFAGNAQQWTTRRLTFYGRAAGTVLDAAPQPMQLIPRDDRLASSVAARFAGRIIDPEVSSVVLQTRRAGTVTEQPLPIRRGEFEVTVPVPVALVDTDFALYEVRAGGRRLVRSIPGVVGGDVYVVHGQSNAAAHQWGGSARAAQHHFVRTFGSSTAVVGPSLGERTWNTGQADTQLNLATIGQWAAQFGTRTVAATNVPVAIMNLAHGGQPVGFFARNDANPSDPATNYGRSLQRLRAAGIDQHVSGLFWTQGESDDNDAKTHVAGVTDLFTDLRNDLVAPRHQDPVFFEMQVRRSPCADASLVELRDAQRRLARDLDATLMTLNGLENAIGCHWDFTGGYQVLGDWAYEIASRTLDGRSTAGVRTPDVSAIHLSKPTSLTVDLTSADQLSIPADARLGFRIGEGSLTVTSVQQRGQQLLLTTSAPVTPGTTVSYVGFQAAGPWIRNQLGVGLATFAEQAR